MTIKEKYLELFVQNCLRAVEITKSKGADYAGSDDTFKNFRESAEAGSIPGKEPLTVEQTILVRLADKDSRVRNLLGRVDFAGEVADEKIEDTLMDRVIYTLILLTWLQMGRPNEDAEYPDTPVQIPLPLERESLSETVTKPIAGALNKLFNWASRQT